MFHDKQFFSAMPLPVPHNSQQLIAQEQANLARGLAESLRVVAPGRAPATHRKAAAELEMLLEVIERQAESGKPVDMEALMTAARGGKK